MSAADIIQIIIGVLSLIATIAVSFLIYWLQTRHEIVFFLLLFVNAFFVLE